MESSIKDLIKEIKRLKDSQTVCSSGSVTAKTRKIRTKWTSEMAQEISQYSGIDLDTSILEVLMKELKDDRDTI
jgi:hypothetical protein